LACCFDRPCQAINGGSNNTSYWRWRKPKEPEAQNIDIDAIYPSEFPETRSGRTKQLLLAVAALIVVAVAVVLGVALSRNSSKGASEEVVTPVPSPPPPLNPPSSTPETELPTDSPTLLPTGLPTVVVTTTPPTAAPITASPTPSAVVNQFLSGLPPYSIELVDSDAGSPQAAALTWLQSDPLYYDYENVYRLNQRYALALLYYSTDGALWLNRDGWLSNGNECTWFTRSSDDICDASFRLSILDLSINGLDGSIPTELELLTDLETMELWDEKLFLTVYPELYVSRCPFGLC
jgi:hypothetical protein